ncbi:hypothetical protein CQW23_11019 [Capsicum baccatum]|uniref:DUF4005 domain-containing protein n=1 Tax=Capsicum baccatum TaxID=33114 RepID=A0A2G2X1A1_CAPBA|nr:hypothetical protein CQW23_11019 [Capsicum baccatum]
MKRSIDPTTYQRKAITGGRIPSYSRINAFFIIPSPRISDIGSGFELTVFLAAIIGLMSVHDEVSADEKSMISEEEKPKVSEDGKPSVASDEKVPVASEEKPLVSALVDTKISAPVTTKVNDGKPDATLDEHVVLVIQTAVRAFLARRAQLKQKHVTKLQAAVRGHLVRRHAVGSLRCVQAIVKMQVLVRARQSNLIAEGSSIKEKLNSKSRRTIQPENNSVNVQIEQEAKTDRLHKSSPDASPRSHITVPESQGTPSSQVSVNPKKIKSEKSGSIPKCRSAHAGKKSPSKSNHAPGTASAEQLPKDHKNEKRRNSFSSTKAGHIDQEARDNSNSSSLPSYMQATESSRAKAIPNSSPRSSPDVHNKDEYIKKRHSLPGSSGRQGSPRIQRSLSNAQQGAKGNGTQFKIVKAAAGRSHTVVVTDDGQSFAFGWNKHGQLGIGHAKNGKPFCYSRLLFPFSVSYSLAPKSDLGHMDPYFIYITHVEITAGLPQYGQLGHATDNEYNTKDSSVRLAYEVQPRPIPIAFFSGETIVKVACGTNHTVAVDKNGYVYLICFDLVHMLGHREQKDEFAPRRVEVFTRQNVLPPYAVVSAGSVNSACTAGGGQLYMWGKIKSTGDDSMYPKPLLDLRVDGVIPLQSPSIESIVLYSSCDIHCSYRMLFKSNHVWVEPTMYGFWQHPVLTTLRDTKAQVTLVGEVALSIPSGTKRGGRDDIIYVRTAPRGVDPASNQVFD